MPILDKIFIVYVNDQIYVTFESQIGAEEFVKDRLARNLIQERIYKVIEYKVDLTQDASKIETQCHKDELQEKCQIPTSKVVPYELLPLIGKIHKLEEMFDDQRGQDCVVHNELDEKIKVLKYDFEQCQRYYGKELGNINNTFTRHEETFKLLHEQIFHLNQLIAGLKND